MAELPRKIREHYESQGLSEERVRALLGAGRAAAAARVQRRRWMWGAAAALVLGLLGYGLATFRSGPETRVASGLEPSAIAAAVVQYFAQPDYELARVSPHPRELVAWLVEHGAPADLRIPDAMAELPSFGCQVLEVQGERVFLICFFPDATPDELASGMPIKREMTVTAPDGSMMKKDRPLVHLVVAPVKAFARAPSPGERVALPSQGEWHFQTWEQNGLVYLAAAPLPAPRLSELVRPL